VLELCLSSNPARATIAHPPKKSYSEKVEHFVIFDEFGHLEAGMTYIYVQKFLKLSAMQ
jgi:hypothetical protein